MRNVPHNFYFHSFCFLIKMSTINSWKYHLPAFVYLSLSSVSLLKNYYYLWFIFIEMTTFSITDFIMGCVTILIKNNCPFFIKYIHVYDIRPLHKFDHHCKCNIQWIHSVSLVWGFIFLFCFVFAFDSSKLNN